MIVLLLALTVLATLGILGIAAGGVYAYVKVNKMVVDVTQTLDDYFSSQSADHPSPFVEFLDQMAELTAQKVGIHVQAAIKGSIGGTMKGVNAELEQVAIDQDPSLAVAQALPKSLRKNPIAMIGLQALINKIGSGAQGSGFRSSGNHQAKFNL